MGINDFVFVKDNAFSDKFCDEIVDVFEHYDLQNITYRDRDWETIFCSSRT